MIREDLITQMIQQIAALIARILKRNISQEALEDELNELSEKLTGLPSTLLLSLPPEEAFRLFEDSDRMVIEKCYFMGEVLRLKGLKSESSEAKKDFFEKALFFYGKCSGKVGEKLQETIDKTIAELKTARHNKPYRPSERKNHNSLPAPDTQSNEPLPASRSQRKKKTSKVYWYAIAAFLLAIGVHSFFDKNEIEITDRNSRFEDGLAHADFQIVNNTNQERLIRLRISAEHSTRKVFGSQYTFLGATEKEYAIAPQSTQKITESFECATQSQRANQTLSITMLSNETVDKAPASAPH